MTRLAERMRPSARQPERLVGPARHVWKTEFNQWRHHQKFHCVLWGPPGSGKTTLAHMLSEASGLSFAHLSAVRDGVKEIREQATLQRGQLIFIDEIHRLSRSQQDVLLPILEHDECWVIGATTESPRAVFQPALLSRMRLLRLQPPRIQDIEKAITAGLAELGAGPAELETERGEAQNPDSSESLAENQPPQDLIACAQRVWNHPPYRRDLLHAAGGDVRLAWNVLENLAAAVQQHGNMEEAREACRAVFENLQRAYTANQHYDYASAMIKSMRGSDPDAALYYAITALDSGEDVVFLLRRCVIFASEDVGNADPQALSVAVSALTAAQNIGMPEARIPLAQAVTYLAATVKSNKCYSAISTVRRWREQAESGISGGSASRTDDRVDASSLLPPRPLVLANAADYRYPHDYPNAFVKMEYLPAAISQLRHKEGPAYRPGDSGVERRLRERLAQLWDPQK